LAVRGKEEGIGGDAAHAHPAAQTFAYMVDFIEHGHAVGQPCFHTRRWPKSALTARTKSSSSP
jgi:hypothetical protein